MHPTCPSLPAALLTPCFPSRGLSSGTGGGPSVPSRGQPAPQPRASRLCRGDPPQLPPRAHQTAWGCRGVPEHLADVRTSPPTALWPSLGRTKDASFSRPTSLLSWPLVPASSLRSISVKSAPGPLQGRQGQTTKEAGHSTWVLAGLRSKEHTYQAGLGRPHEEVCAQPARTLEVYIVAYMGFIPGTAQMGPTALPLTLGSCDSS